MVPRFLYEFIEHVKLLIGPLKFQLTDGYLLIKVSQINHRLCEAFKVHTQPPRSLKYKHFVLLSVKFDTHGHVVPLCVDEITL